MAEDAVPDLTGAISPRTGIVRRLLPIPFHHDDPLVYSYSADISDTSRFSPHKCTNRSGGAGLTPEAAQAAAVGESLERYCCNFYDRSRIRVGCFEDFPDRAVDPSTWVLFSQRQYESPGFPFAPFTPTTTASWVEAESLVSGQTVLVPASMTYLPFEFEPWEKPLSQTISTGLACRPSKPEATLYGLYECIERDAFTIYWLNALTRSRVDPLQVNFTPGDNLFEKHFARPGIEYRIWDITTDIPVPSYFCVAWGHSNIGPLFCVGSTSHLDPRRALVKVLTEAGQGRPYLRYEYNRNPHWQCRYDFTDVNDFEDHAQVYSRRPELVSQLQFCTSTEAEMGPVGASRSTGNVDEDLGRTVALLHERGLDVLVVDLTTSDVRELGLHVVRVFVPGLQPLHGDHRYPFLGGNRLHQVPVRLGLREEPADETDLFGLPHPFP